MNIPKSKLKRAKKICDKIAAELEANANEGYCGVLYDIETEHPGIWFHGDESINVEHLERTARALVEKLKLKPFFCSWAYTCSKPRIDEFGGGAFAIVRGKDTIWCDALQNILTRTERILKGVK
jgi:hypothetical protein